MQVCESLGLIGFVVRDSFYDRKVFLEKFIRLPICHNETADEAMTDTHSLKHFVARDQQKPLMELVLQVASLVAGGSC